MGSLSMFVLKMSGDMYDFVNKAVVLESGTVGSGASGALSLMTIILIGYIRLHPQHRIIIIITISIIGKGRANQEKQQVRESVPLAVRGRLASPVGESWLHIRAGNTNNKCRKSQTGPIRRLEGLRGRSADSAQFCVDAV